MRALDAMRARRSRVARGREPRRDTQVTTTSQRHKTPRCARTTGQDHAMVWRGGRHSTRHSGTLTVLSVSRSRLGSALPRPSAGAQRGQRDDSLRACAWRQARGIASLGARASPTRRDSRAIIADRDRGSGDALSLFLTVSMQDVRRMCVHATPPPPHDRIAT